MRASAPDRNDAGSAASASAPPGETVDDRRRIGELEDQVANLVQALETSRLIGAAIGIIMSLRGTSMDEAFDALRSASMTSHRKLREIAAEVVQTRKLPDPRPAKRAD